MMLRKTLMIEGAHSSDGFVCDSEETFGHYQHCNAYYAPYLACTWRLPRSLSSHFVPVVFLTSSIYPVRLPEKPSYGRNREEGSLLLLSLCAWAGFSRRLLAPELDVWGPNRSLFDMHAPGQICPVLINKASTEKYTLQIRLHTDYTWRKQFYIKNSNFERCQRLRASGPQAFLLFPFRFTVTILTSNISKISVSFKWFDVCQTSGGFYKRNKHVHMYIYIFIICMYIYI
jgi:hypothetical protein